MPAQNSFDPERFATLMASYDVANPSELEALSAARAMRRAAGDANLRVVDALYRADVIEALDAALQPVREEPPELRGAFARIAELAEAITREREISAELRRELSARQTAGPSGPDGGQFVINGGLVAGMIAIVVALLIAAALF